MPGSFLPLGAPRAYLVPAREANSLALHFPGTRFPDMGNFMK
jgi:hypothetical protein